MPGDLRIYRLDVKGKIITGDCRRTSYSLQLRTVSTILTSTEIGQELPLIGSRTDQRQWPSYEQATAATPGQLGGWALPRDIIERLGLPKNGVTSASVSRALRNLSKRGLVARASGEVANVGKAFRYLRITDRAR